MKAYTDIQQSRKLAEILPIGSADMCYRIVAYNPNDTHEYQPYCFVSTLESDVPCWSLSALLESLPEITIEKIKAEDGYEGYYYFVSYKDQIAIPYNKELIDGFVEMIVNLHEEKLL